MFLLVIVDCNGVVLVVELLIILLGLILVLGVLVELFVILSCVVNDVFFSWLLLVVLIWEIGIIFLGV